MNYYYKYLKYKTKYLELKGGKMKYGLYGLYSYVGNKLNLRTNNKRFNEINYVHDLPLYEDNNKVDNIIIRHLKSKYKNWKYYNGIKSFEFVPYLPNTSEKDIEIIKNVIKDTYFTEEIEKIGKLDKVKWTMLNKLKRFRYRGYSDKISEKIINAYADKAEQVLSKEQNYKLDEYTEIRKKALELQSKRKCNAIHEHPNKSINNSDLYKSILLEEEIKDMQLLLSNVKTGESYEKNNPKIYRDPFTLVNEKLGILSWNMIINKATINCIMNHHDVLFPMRIVLDMDSKTLFYDNILQSKKYSNYMGFFLIRFINDEDDYTKGSKPHVSKEQYYIFFVFKNVLPDFDFPLYTYTLTNFRNNIVNWGTVTEKKTVLFYEILQLICMYLNNNIHFYLISIKNDNNINNNDIIKSWIYSKDLEYVNFDNSEIHILVSKHNIDSISDKLNKSIQNEKKYKYIKYNEQYKLFECHFGWYDDPNDKFCIKLGNMENSIKQKLKTDACIQNIDSELYTLDKKRYIQSNGIVNFIDKYFDLINDPIMNIKLQKN
jgi:hypothetical protein